MTRAFVFTLTAGLSSTVYCSQFRIRHPAGPLLRLRTAWRSSPPEVGTYETNAINLSRPAGFWGSKAVKPLYPAAGSTPACSGSALHGRCCGLPAAIPKKIRSTASLRQLETFLARQRERDRHVPGFVEHHATAITGDAPTSAARDLSDQAVSPASTKDTADFGTAFWGLD